MTAEANVISYAINNPKSLSDLLVHLPDLNRRTSHPAKAGPQSQTAVCLGLDTSEMLEPSRDKLTTELKGRESKRELKRNKRVDTTVGDYVKMLKARTTEEMVSGFGPGKDFKLPESWVKDWITEEMIEYQDVNARSELEAELVADLEGLGVADKI
jgi:hypothetical protein